MTGKMGQNGLPSLRLLFSDSLLGFLWVLIRRYSRRGKQPLPHS